MKPVMSRHLRWSLFLLVCAVFPPNNLHAGRNSDKPSAQLVFRIIPENSTVPSGSQFINIEVEIRNTGEHSVRLSPVGIGSHVSVSNRPCSLSEGIRNQIISADPLPSFRATKVVSIGPGGAYQHTIRLELTPKEFFAPGVYSISMYFSGNAGGSEMKDIFRGDLKSNEVLFEIAEPG